MKTKPPPYFPAPYPDENLYSIVSRFYVRGAALTQYEVMRRLFGGRALLSSLIFVPRYVDRADAWFGAGSPMTREKLAVSHTCHPYFSVSYSEQTFSEMEEVLAGNGEPPWQELSSRCRNANQWLPYLRFCPECAKEDLDSTASSTGTESINFPASSIARSTASGSATAL